MTARNRLILGPLAAILPLCSSCAMSSEVKSVHLERTYLECHVSAWFDATHADADTKCIFAGQAPQETIITADPADVGVRFIRGRHAYARCRQDRPNCFKVTWINTNNDGRTVVTMQSSVSPQIR